MGGPLPGTWVGPLGDPPSQDGGDDKITRKIEWFPQPACFVLKRKKGCGEW